MNKVIPTMIVSVFPGLGKTTLAHQFPQMFCDLESSDFHYWGATNENGQALINSRWPYNYIEQIAALSRATGMYQAVFVSSHDTVRQKMGEARIPYTLIYPEDTPEMKKILFDRYKSRGSSPEFIQSMDENWSEYIKSMAEDGYATKKLALNPDALLQWGVWCAYA